MPTRKTKSRRPRLPKKIDRLISSLSGLGGWTSTDRIQDLESKLREAVRDALARARGTEKKP